MASHYIATYVLITDRGGDYGPGTFINVNWNDVTEAVEVYTAEDFFSGYVLQTSGPSLGSASINYTVTNYFYKFCEDTTLNYFTLTPSTFPYVRQEYIENSFSCIITEDPPPVCDLQIADNPTITEASNIGSNDGSVEVSASSTNGTIKYALFDFDYATEGQTSPIFTGLYGAEYTIYAKDEGNCIDTITVIVPVSENYGLKYFMEFTDMHGDGDGYDHKIEVYERGYSGPVLELLASGDPFTKKLNSDSEDKFFIIRASDISFTFVSQTSFEYHDLFSEDERQFLVKHYLDDGGGYDLDWTGYLIPFLYSEQYTDIVYKITVTATDGLGSLKGLDFVDESDNNLKGTLSAIDIINLILKKTGLLLNVRSAINMYEAEFDSTATDDTLAQVYYDVSIYYDKEGNPAKCDVVLKEILTDYLAAIAQSDNTWIIWRPEELITDFDYREFTALSEYDSNGNINPVLPLDIPTNSNRLAWKERSGVLSMLPSYGRFIVNQKLIQNTSLFPSYSFELEDIRPYIAGTFFFYGWALIINEGTGMVWGIKNVDRGDSRGALYVQWEPFLSVDPPRKSITVYTTQSRCEVNYQDSVKFSIDYMVESNFDFPFVKIQISLKVGDFYFNPKEENAPWTPIDPGYVDIYVDRFNSWNTFDGTFTSPSPIGAVQDLPIELFIKLNNNGQADYPSEAAVRGLTTLAVPRGLKVTAIASDGLRHYYELVSSTEGNAPPNTLRPIDYDGTDNKCAWVSLGSDSGNPPTMNQYIDNVIFEVLPDGFKTPDNLEYIVTVNPNNKRTLEIETNHGDCPTTVRNARYAYKNYIKRSNGLGGFDPTSLWARDGYSESDTIQNIMLKTLVGQFSKSSRRLTGSVIGDVYLKPYSVLDDQSEAGRNYLVQGFEELGRLNEYSVDLYEIKESEESNPDGAAFSDTAFGIAFDI